jgi:hypothetical protein
MPVDPSLLELMTHVFQWKQVSGRDAWQAPTFAAPVDVGGYHVQEEHEVTDDNGAKRIAQGTVYTDDVYGIKPGDVLEWDGVELGEIIRVTDYFDNSQPYGSEIHHG